MVSVSSILTVTSMNKVKFQHKAIVTITNVALKTVIGAVFTALASAIGVAMMVALDIAPQLVYKLDIAFGGGI